ncbi:MAG TPA: GH92 family glycosyl hydrolase [Polyangiaceae bacterium]|nr:GH92 family glycosyl hydrolase [Polyangiaceae bacterium]
MRRIFPVILAPCLLACSSSGDPEPVPGAPPVDEVDSCWVAPPDVTAAPIAATAPLIRYVDPFIGTGGLGFGVGSAFPGPQRPFGMVRPGPDTMNKSGAVAFAHCSGYSYEDDHIYGFSQTRMHGTGIVDYGTIGFLPTIGMTSEKTAAKGRKIGFSHDKEIASPGFYEVSLNDGTKVELTAAERVALHRYTFPKGADAAVLIDIGHALPDVSIVDGKIDIDPASSTITGFSHFVGGYSNRFGGMPVYFAARFARPFVKHGVWKAGVLAEGEAAQTGGDIGAWVNFDVASDQSVGVAVAISFIDVEHAKASLEAEAAIFDFNATKKSAEEAWETALGRVLIEARSERDLEVAYTALYHTLLMPTLATEADGSYRGMDGQVHAANGFRYYTDLSLWDTYRTLHPWLSLVYPEIQRDMVRSITAMALEGGAPPQWPLGIGETGGMVGDSSAVVVADSWARGVRDVDLGAAYALLKESATQKLPKWGRDHVEEYTTKGWISIESGGSSGSSTLEYALDDAALAAIAEALGETEDAAMFRERGGNWKNLWDASSGLLVGRRADGSFASQDDPTVWQDYWAEGTTWHYTWFAPQDIDGLAGAMGGRDKMINRLDEFFAMSSCQAAGHLLPKPYYWHSNEPVLFVPWIYSELDDAARTAKWTRWALASEYGDGPDGLPGNDDGGTMSAWWLFSASGIFPRIGTAEYLLGAPILPRVTLKLPGGDFVISSKGPANGYPVAATLNGEKLPRPRFNHAQIEKGGELEIELAKEPGGWISP